jgi:hypothetical protein
MSDTKEPTMGKVIPFRPKKAPIEPASNKDYQDRMDSIKKSLERINQLVADIRNQSRFGYIKTETNRDPPE